MEPLARSLLMPMAVCGGGLSFMGPEESGRKLCPEEEIERAKVLLGRIAHSVVAGGHANGP